MKKLFFFTLNGVDYPYRKIYFERKWVIIATTDLDEKILVGDSYLSREAQWIDEQIIFYVKPHEIHLQSNKLVEILKHNIN